MSNGWSKSEVLKELLPMLCAHSVTYFQWEGLTVSFDAKTKADPRPVPQEKLPIEPATVVPTGDKK